LAATPPNLVIADVTEERGVADDVFVKLETHFASVPLIWIASPGQWAPGAREGPPSRRCAVFETPFDYRRLLGEVARLVCLPSGPSFQKPGLISGRVIAYVSTHFGTTSVEDMARAVQLSPGHLCRVFRGEMGVGPKDFLTRVRLEAAKCLLRETREKVAAIATEVGCYDAPHLARLFRNHGCAPRAYRQADWGD
jgi:AraC-like DNA-binding protein